MGEPEPLLHTEGLAIGYADQVLQRNIEITLRKGELTALIGVNGIGKSTLLRTLGGLQPVREGKVFLCGEDTRSLTAVARARLISMVLTGLPSTGTLDVGTVVALGRQPWTDRWGTEREEDRRIVQQALQCAGAAHLEERTLSTCSDGERQKVLIARALAQNTPAILLDEPTAFLDLPNRVSIIRTLRAIAVAENKAVFFSTHDLQLALDLCDRIVLMRREAALWQGTPAQALASGELSNAFAGTGIRFDPATGTHRFDR